MRDSNPQPPDYKSGALPIKANQACFFILQYDQFVLEYVYYNFLFYEQYLWLLGDR